MAFEIQYSDEAVEDLVGIPTFDRVRIVAAIDEQLPHQALVETRQRKPLKEALSEGALDSREGLTVWELRVDKYRVFYDVDAETGVLVIRIVLKGTLDTEYLLKMIKEGRDQ